MVGKNSHVTRDGKERRRVRLDELDEFGRRGACEGNDVGAEFFEESADDGEPDASVDGQRAKEERMRMTWMRL